MSKSICPLHLLPVTLDNALLLATLQVAQDAGPRSPAEIQLQSALNV